MAGSLQRPCQVARRAPARVCHVRDPGNAARFAEFFWRDEPTIVYFGKLIENKGVQVLLAALDGLDARAVVVGFGDFREELEALAPPGTLFTGALEHRHLRHLLPLCDVAVVPSIFPEAFGMVAAEAAAAGLLPVVSAHSGLAEVAAKQDPLYDWSKLRADYLGQANLTLAKEYDHGSKFRFLAFHL